MAESERGDDIGLRKKERSFYSLVLYDLYALDVLYDLYAVYDLFETCLSLTWEPIANTCIEN